MLPEVPSWKVILCFDVRKDGKHRNKLCSSLWLNVAVLKAGRGRFGFLGMRNFSEVAGQNTRGLTPVERICMIYSHSISKIKVIYHSLGCKISLTGNYLEIPRGG